MAMREDPFEGYFTPSDVKSLGDKNQAQPEAPAKEVQPAPKKAVKSFKDAPSVSKLDQIVINPVIQDVREETNRGSDTMVVLNGRMNPVTKGHEENVVGMKKLAAKHDADHIVIATHSHDTKTVGSDNRNPLSPEQKLKHLQRAFPDTNVTTTDKQNPSIFHKLADIHKQGYKHVIIAAGGDRTEDYERIKQYNGKKTNQEGKPLGHGYYKFKSITVASTGERKQGVSGTDMRKYAESGDMKKFKENLPSKIQANKEHVQDLYDDVRSGMKLNEHVMSTKAKLALHEKAVNSGVPLDVLSTVYDRGIAEWTEDMSNTPQQHAFARINSFISFGQAYRQDADLRDANEAVDLQTRMKRKVNMAMHRRKIERAREIAMKRFAKNSNLRSRALKIARNTLRKRLGGARGANYSNLSTAQKIAVDTMLDGRRKQIKAIANKIITRVKRDEAGRLTGQRTSSAKSAIVASYQPDENACVIEEDHIYFEMTEEQWDEFRTQLSEENNENRALNKPFRTPGGPKKFAVYVKNDKGNVIKLGFGDPNLEIKRDDPDRRKAYRARHGCDNPGPKWKANYWSCNWSWSSSKKVGA